MRRKAAEGADQHEQGRARQVEVGQQPRGGAEPVAGGDEDRGLAGEGRSVPSSSAALSSSRSAVVPTATIRPPAAARGVQRARPWRPRPRRLGVHAVVGDVLGLHRQEGAGADVQRHEMPARRRAPRASAISAAREVQARRRRGDRAVLAGVDGLVIDEVAIVFASGARRCRAAAASPRARRWRGRGRARRGRRPASPRRPRPCRPRSRRATPSRQARSLVSPKPIRSPIVSRRPGLAKALQREARGAEAGSPRPARPRRPAGAGPSAAPGSPWCR